MDLEAIFFQWTIKTSKLFKVPKWVLIENINHVWLSSDNPNCSVTFCGTQQFLRTFTHNLCLIWCFDAPNRNKRQQYIDFKEIKLWSISLIKVVLFSLVLPSPDCLRLPDGWFLFSVPSFFLCLCVFVCDENTSHLVLNFLWQDLISWFLIDLIKLKSWKNVEIYF